jgi:hypothetical protein
MFLHLHIYGSGFNIGLMYVCNTCFLVSNDNALLHKIFYKVHRILIFLNELIIPSKNNHFLILLLRLVAAISPIDRGLAIQSGSNKMLGKIVDVCTKKWVARKRSPAYPAAFGYLTTWLGKVKTMRKGTGHPTSQCCWSSTVKAPSHHFSTAELLRDKP